MGALKGLVTKVVGILAMWIILMLICVIVIIFMCIAPDGDVKHTFDATYKTWDNARSIKIYSIVEGWFIIPLNEIFGQFRERVIYSTEFRLVVLLIVVLATGLMGLAMVVGEQKITVKEFAMDVIIIFGSAAFLLSPQVGYYMDFFYNDLIVAASNWAISVFTEAIFSLMDLNVTLDKSNPTYSVMDMVAAIFFDETVAARVRTKLLGLLFAGYIHYVPVLVIVLFYAVLSTASIFFAILSGKLTIMLTLQFVPFFIMFASINDVKIKVSKNPKHSGKSFLWNLIDGGIIQPWIFLTLISFASGIMLYAFVLAALDDLLTFVVVMDEKNAGLRPLTYIPIFGELIRLFIKVLPKAVGLNAQHMHSTLLQAIFGVMLFRMTFPSVVSYVQSVALSANAGKAASKMFTENGGVFSSQNSIGFVNERIIGAPMAASETLGAAIMSGGSPSAIAGSAKKSMDKLEKDAKTENDTGGKSKGPGQGKDGDENEKDSDDKQGDEENSEEGTEGGDNAEGGEASSSE